MDRKRDVKVNESILDACLGGMADYITVVYHDFKPYNAYVFSCKPYDCIVAIDEDYKLAFIGSHQGMYYSITFNNE